MLRPNRRPKWQHAGFIENVDHNNNYAQGYVTNLSSWIRKPLTYTDFAWGIDCIDIDKNYLHIAMANVVVLQIVC